MMVFCIKRVESDANINMYLIYKYKFDACVR